MGCRATGSRAIAAPTEGETTHHLFARSRTLRIKLTFGFSISSVISISPLPAVLGYYFGSKKAIFIEFRGPKALLNLHGCPSFGSKAPLGHLSDKPTYHPCANFKAGRCSRRDSGKSSLTKSEC